MLSDLTDPCDHLVELHEQLAKALAEGDARTVRRLNIEIETARYVCAALACGIRMRLGGYFQALEGAERRNGN